MKIEIGRLIEIVEGMLPLEGHLCRGCQKYGYYKIGCNECLNKASKEIVKLLKKEQKKEQI